MTTSIEIAKTVTESNLQGGTDRDFSHEETASIQHTNAAIRQAVRQHAVSRAKRKQHTSMQAVLQLEQDALLVEAKSHARQYAEAEAAVKDRIVK